MKRSRSESSAKKQARDYLRKVESAECHRQNINSSLNCESNRALAAPISDQLSD